MKKIILSFCFLAIWHFSQSQNNISNLSSFLNADRQTSSNLVAAYTQPLINELSHGMMSGWYNTAATHKKFGIDVGVALNVVFTPSSDKYFQPSAISSSTTFTNTTVPGSVNAPTIFGPKETTDYLSTYNNGSNNSVTVRYSGPEGLDLKKDIGFSAVPLPLAQVGIGLIKNTDLKIRVLPKITTNGISATMLGFGLQHDIKQYINTVARELPFDLSVMVAYNTLTTETNLTSLVNTAYNAPINTDGKITSKLNLWMAQALISKKISVITFYAGLGYGASSSKVKVTGQYTVTPSREGQKAFQITDPVSFTTTTKSPRLTLGVKLKFGPFYFNSDYTIEKYNIVSVGTGLSFR